MAKCCNLKLCQRSFLFNLLNVIFIRRGTFICHNARLSEFIDLIWETSPFGTQHSPPTPIPNGTYNWTRLSTLYSISCLISLCISFHLMPNFTSYFLPFFLLENPWIQFLEANSGCVVSKSGAYSKIYFDPQGLFTISKRDWKLLIEGRVEGRG